MNRFDYEHKKEQEVTPTFTQWCLKNIFNNCTAEIITDKETQCKGIDVIFTAPNGKQTKVDYKFDFYDNEANFVAEVEQRDGTTWLTKEGHETDLVIYVKVNNGKVFLFNFDDLIDFTDTWTYKEAFEHITQRTETIYKNFKVGKDLNAKRTYIWKEHTDFEKYVNPSLSETKLYLMSY